MPENIQSIVAEIPALRRYAASLLKGRTGADDLVQDALERAIEKFHLYQPDTRLRSWLFAVMRNIFLDHFRKRKKQESMAVQLAEQSATHAPPNQFASLVSKDLMRHIETLKPEYRELLLLVAGRGISYEEAAEATGVPLGTVRSRLFRARNLLLKKLEGEAITRPGRPAKRNGLPVSDQAACPVYMDA
jgi:RNA polymerase sigma-70 factor (ECF subfamily)